jgi:hypothetical protein
MENDYNAFFDRGLKEKGNEYQVFSDTDTAWLNFLGVKLLKPKKLTKISISIWMHRATWLP